MPGLTSFRSRELTCLCVATLATELETLYGKHAWVYDAIRTGATSQVLRGRQPVLAGSLNDAPVVVKRLHHGGLAAALLKDRFLGSRRFLEHFDSADYLNAHGISTPRVLFVSWRRSGLVSRGEVGFEQLPEGMDADQLLFGKLPADPELCARKIGALVSRLHKLRFLHRDLNLMNFYVSRAGQLFLLDLDNARLDQVPSVWERARNLARLERSIRKQGRASSPQYVESLIAQLREGYEATNAELVLPGTT